MGPLPDIKIAKGSKLQDATVLNLDLAVLSVKKDATCSSFRQASSRLSLYQKNNGRERPFESLFLKYSCCKAKTRLSTSRQLGGKGSGLREVHRKAALVSCQFEGTGVTHFCTMMNLSLPASTDVYTKYPIQIENATRDHAKEVMNGAAER